MDFMQEVKEALAVVIRVERARKKISQEELALNAELQRKFISDIEVSRHQPSVGNLIKIVKALDVNFLDFMADFEKELKKRNVL